MNLEALLITLRARGVKVTDKGAALDFEPPSLVTPDEAEFIRANAEAFAALLRSPEANKPPEALSIDLQIDAAIQRKREAAEARQIVPVVKTTRYRNVHGDLLPLERLTAEDVQRLRRRGSLTDEEAKRWLSRSSTGFVF